MVLFILVVIGVLGLFLGFTGIAYRVTMKYWDEESMGKKPPSFIHSKIAVGNMLPHWYKFNLTNKIRRLALGGKG